MSGILEDEGLHHDFPGEPQRTSPPLLPVLDSKCDQTGPHVLQVGEQGNEQKSDLKEIRYKKLSEETSRQSSGKRKELGPDLWFLISP